jgi:ABC-type branched-subunit amino acid transport system permease subunit
MDWTYIQANYDWAGHIVEGLVMAGVVAVLASFVFTRRLGVFMGIAFAIGHFHGREKRDFEVSVKMRPPHLEGYEMWKWSFDQATDFWPTALVLLALAIVVYRRWR